MQLRAVVERPTFRLSMGEKKRVAIASVLILDPEVMLLDEPTAGLDPRSQSGVIDLLEEWQGSGRTVVLATHDLGVIEGISRTAAWSSRRDASSPTGRRARSSPTSIS